MNIAEKIWFTWMVLAIPICMSGWLIEENKHPRIMIIIIAFALAPLAIGGIVAFAYALLLIWK